MSISKTPAFPDDFGNPWMSNLQEIEALEPVPFRPETIGWYGLAAVVTLALLWLVWKAWRQHRAAAYRRLAERELDGLAADTAQGLARLPELLKRVALAGYPRTTVADLSGQAWLAFLNDSMGTTAFTTGAGRWLPDLAYDPGAADRLSRADRDELVSLSRRWIRKHPRGRKSGGRE